MVVAEFGVKHGSILLCINGSGWWWSNGVADIFLEHFGLFSTNWSSFKCHSLPEHCYWPCPSYVYPSCHGYFQLDNAPCHKAQIISNWFPEHDNEFTILNRSDDSISGITDSGPLNYLKIMHTCGGDPWYMVVLYFLIIQLPIVYYSGR